MKSEPSKAIENGLTAQLTKSVTPIPRQYCRTSTERGKIDLDQHRHDHQPDQHRDRQIDLGDFGRADRMEHPWHDVAKNNARRRCKARPTR